MEPMKLYEQWLRDFADDAETVQDLLAIKDDPKEIEDRFYRDLEFGTAGMRGVLGAGTNRLNKYNVRRVSRALAKYILTTPDGAQKGVAIAYDSRRKSDEFAREAALVLCAAGIRVFLYESLRPVPVLSFTIRHLQCIAGIVITASHNPKQYNGYKAYWTDGGQMPPESVKGITDRLPDTTYEESLPMDEKEALDKGLLTYIGKDVDDAYIAAVKKLSVNPELAKEMGETLKIVYTPLHGSGNIPVRRIFDEIGMKHVYVVKEQELPDGEFPTVKVPNPEDPAAFTLALKLQKELGADLCVGTDPDCDRVGIACMTDDGLRLLNGNQIGCILLHYILSQKKERGELPANAAAVASIVSTEMARAICEDYDTKFIKVLTGFKYIAEQIQLFETTGCNTFMFGFEESYGFLSGTDVRDKDGVNACMLIAEAASWYKKMYNKTLADAIDMLYEKYGYYGDKVTSFVLPGKDGLEKMQHTMAALRANPPKDFAGEKVVAVRDYQTSVRTAADGATEALTLPKSNVLYYELENKSWICVRPSGTEPKIKLYVNAVSDASEKTAALLDAYSDAAVKLLESL
ncbi:MAG: phospho-sugar mutase [Clostridia bacterium]|nr:phospho-sugar mutase [Clostridia bacterium]